MKHLNTFNEGKDDSLEIDAWVTFQDGQDGSYSIHIFGTKAEAVKDLGTDSPETLYDDGGMEKIKIKLVNKDGKWTIQKGGNYICFE